MTKQNNIDEKTKKIDGLGGDGFKPQSFWILPIAIQFNLAHATHIITIFACLD